jgi:hypothetical protein
MPPSFLFVWKKQQEIFVSLCFPWHKEFTEDRKNCELQGGCSTFLHSKGIKTFW